MVDISLKDKSSHASSNGFSNNCSNVEDKFSRFEMLLLQKRTEFDLNCPDPSVLYKAEIVY